MTALGLGSAAKNMQISTGLTIAIAGIFAMWKGIKHLLNGDVDLFSLLETFLGAGAGVFGLVRALQATKLGKTIGLGRSIAVSTGIVLTIAGVEILMEGIKQNDVRKKVLGILGITGGVITSVISLTPALKKGIEGIKNFASGLSKMASNASISAKNLALLAVGVAGAAASMVASKNIIKEYNEGLISQEEAIGKIALTSATAAASGALAGAQIGMAFGHPVIGAGIGAIVGGLGNIVTSLIGVGSNSEMTADELSDAMSRINSDISEAKEMFNNFAGEYLSNTEKINQTFSTNMSEIDYYENLSKKLRDLIDDQGHVLQGKEDIVDYILGELNKGIGTELERNGELITKNGEVVGSYKDIIESIEQTISAMKRQATQEALSEQYKEDYKFLLTAGPQIVEYEEKLKKLKEKIDSLPSDSGERKKARDEYRELSKSLEEIRGKVDEAHERQEKFDSYVKVSSEEMSEAEKTAYDEIVNAAIEAKGRQLTVEETMGARYQALAKTNVAKWIEEYDKANDATKEMMLIQSSTLDSYGPELREKWKKIAKGSADDFTKAINQVEPEMKKEILKDIQTAQGLTPQVIRVWGDMAKNSNKEFQEELKGVDDATRKEILKAISTTEGYIPNSMETWLMLAEESEEAYISALQNLPFETAREIDNLTYQVQQGEVPLKKASEVLARGFNPLHPDEINLAQYGAIGISNYIHGISKNEWGVRNTSQNIANATIGPLNSITSSIYSIGMRVTEGFQMGMLAKRNIITSAVTTITNLIPKAFRDILKIKSPSRVMAHWASFVPEGIAEGIDRNADEVFNSMKKISEGIIVTPQDTVVEQTVSMNREFSDNVKTQVNAGLSGSIQSNMKEMFTQAMAEANVNVQIEAKTEEGVIVKKAVQGIKDYTMQTGEMPFPVLI